MNGGYIAIGHEPAPPVELATPVKFWPVIPTGHEICERCEAIRPRDLMRLVDTTSYGEPLYECQQRPTPPGEGSARTTDTP